MLTSLLLCAAAATAYRQQFPLPRLTVPDGWGVNIHFNDPQPGEMELLARGGSRWVRQDLSWHAVEREKGVYDFEPLSRLFEACRRNGVRPIVILDYGNDLYQKGSPRTPESRKAFCDMVAALMAKFKGRGAVWEMWNEPNIFFWQPRPNVDEYIALAAQVGKTIRRVAPQEWYIGPATSGFDWQFLDKCFRSGLLEYWDAVSVHPYRSSEPESVTPDWARLRSAIDRSKPKGKSIPMISGEWGYSELYSGLSLSLQSQYIARQYLTNLMNGVGLSIWYDWKDDGPDPKEPEHHFGSLYRDLEPKPTYLNKKTVAEALAGYTYHLRLAQPAPSDYVLAFRKGRSIRYAAWTTRSASVVTLPDRQVVSLTGSPAIVKAKPGPATDLVLAWHALPPSLSVGSPEEAKASSAALRTAIPTGATVQTPKIADSLSPTPSRVQVVLGKGGIVLRQETTIDRTRPVSVQLAPTANGLRAILRNPGGRTLDSVLSGRFGSQQSRTRVRLAASDREKTVVLRSGSPDGIRADLRLGTEPVVTDARVDMLPSFELGRYSLIDDGEPKLEGRYEQQTGSELRVRYEFPVGWKFFQVVPIGRWSEPLPGQPVSLGLWVWSDGKGDLLRMRYTDATGQTFQPDGGALDWKGWRYVSFPFDGIGGRWGGMNDGTVHFPIRLSAIALVDSPGGRGGRGEVAIRDVSLISK